MAYLIVREPGRIAFSRELDVACVVGRDEEADLVLRDRLVSRRHVRLVPAGGGWTATDLSSTHGTFVNGARVTERLLHDQDQLQVGNVILRFRAGEQADIAPVYSVTAARDEAPRGPDADMRRLGLLYDVARAIGALAEPDELAGRLLDGAIDVLGADAGVVGLLDRAGIPARRIARARGAEADEASLSARLLDTLLVAHESALWRDAAGRPVLGAPLLVAGRAIGFLVIAGAARAEPSDLDFLTALAHVAAAALAQASEHRRLARLAEVARADSVELLGESAPMQRLRARIAKVAAADAAVLIRGESGTGKELVARMVHALSTRAEQAFVAVNCAAIPDTLIESELFGHEKGAFTGALRRRRGKFALADGATLFLDEIGDLGAAAQAKLLRAIEEGEIQPVGAEVPLEVDVRIVAATHRPLEDDIAAGRFRADLFYRLAVVEIAVPPLRERGDDIALLANTFLARVAERLGRRVDGFAPGALEALRRYPWPGNVRQLANEVERAVLLADGPLVELDELRARVEVADEGATTIAEAERAAVKRAVAESGGNLVAAARLLGVARGTLYRKLKRYKLLPD